MNSGLTRHWKRASRAFCGACLGAALAAAAILAASNAAQAQTPPPKRLAPATPVVDVGISVANGVTTVLPGQGLTYTILITNRGPDEADTVVVEDNFPAGFSFNRTRIDQVLAAVTPTLSDGHAIRYTIGLLKDGFVRLTLYGSVAPTATGRLTDTASAEVLTPALDANTANNTAQDADPIDSTVRPSADVGVSLTDGAARYAPGQILVYTATVINRGPAIVSDLRIEERFPSALAYGGYRAALSSVNGALSTGYVTGLLSITASLPVSSVLEIVLTGTVDVSLTGVLTHSIVSLVPPGWADPNPADNASTDFDFAQNANPIGGVYLPLVTR